MSREARGPVFRNSWPARTNHCSSTVRDDSRVDFPNVVLVTRLAADGRAQRTSAPKTSPACSAQPASSPVDYDVILKTTPTAELFHAHDAAGARLSGQKREGDGG